MPCQAQRKKGRGAAPAASGDIRGAGYRVATHRPMEKPGPDPIQDRAACGPLISHSRFPCADMLCLAQRNKGGEAAPAALGDIRGAGYGVAAHRPMEKPGPDPIQDRAACGPLISHSRFPCADMLCLAQRNKGGEAAPAASGDIRGAGYGVAAHRPDTTPKKHHATQPAHKKARGSPGLRTCIVRRWADAKSSSVELLFLGRAGQSLHT